MSSSQDDLLEYRRRLDDSAWPVEMQIKHETIESIYTHDPNGYLIEITMPLRPVTPQEDLDANLTIDALLDVVAEPDPTLGKLLARKAELIVDRAAAWELARAGQEPGGDHAVRPRRAGEHAPGQGSRRGPRRDGRPDRPVLRDHLGRRDRDRPPRHRVPARGLVQRRRRHRAGRRITQHDKDALRVEPA